MDEFFELGRTAFLGRYGFGKSRDFMVVNPRNGQQCDSKAIVGVAFGKQFPDRGPLKAADFSGGEATVVIKLRNLGFEVQRIGEDWSQEEVDLTVTAYFDMLLLESRQEPYNKSAHNNALRLRLNARSKASIELKHANISAVLAGMDLPTIAGYKPRGNSQLLLRKAVQAKVLEAPLRMLELVDALQEMKPAEDREFRARIVDAPDMEDVVALTQAGPRLRTPRKCDFAARDELNRKLGRAGEAWAIEYEQRRLADEGMAELFQRVDWISDRLGDGAGYDILSFDRADSNRYIEVKTTNGGHRAPFIISRNELDFARENAEAFHLYRVFQFRSAPSMYALRGDISQLVHLEPIDYRASFRRIAG